MRKEALLQYNDEITISYLGDSDIDEAIEIHKEKISSEVQAKSITRFTNIDGRNWTYMAEIYLSGLKNPDKKHIIAAFNWI